MSDYSYSDDDSSMASLSEESGSDDDELIEIENAFCEAEGAWLHAAYVCCMRARLVPPCSHLLVLCLALSPLLVQRFVTVNLPRLSSCLSLLSHDRKLAQSQTLMTSE